MKLEIRLATDGSYYWAIVAPNGKIFATSETYTRRASARRACKAFVRHMNKKKLAWQIVDTTDRVRRAASKKKKRK